MTVTTTDEVLCIEDEDVEIRAHGGLVELGIGARAWVHPGVAITVRDGAIAYVKPGVDVEAALGGDTDTDTVVTAWTDDSCPPEHARLIGEEAQEVVGNEDPST